MLRLEVADFHALQSKNNQLLEYLVLSFAEIESLRSKVLVSGSVVPQ